MKFAAQRDSASWPTSANSARYPRSRRRHDYYWGDQNVSFPARHIENGGGVLQDPLLRRNRRRCCRLVRKAAAQRKTLAQLASRCGLLVGPPAPCCQDPETASTLRQQAVFAFNTLANISKAHDRAGFYRWLDNPAGR